MRETWRAKVLLYSKEKHVLGGVRVLYTTTLAASILGMPRSSSAAEDGA